MDPQDWSDSLSKASPLLKKTFDIMLEFETGILELIKSSSNTKQW